MELYGKKSAEVFSKLIAHNDESQSERLNETTEIADDQYSILSIYRCDTPRHCYFRDKEKRFFYVSREGKEK